jgi:hypothetical protein
MNIVKAVHKMFSNLRKGLEGSYSKPKRKRKSRKKLSKKKVR